MDFYCPATGGKLAVKGEFMISPEGKKYPVVCGVPILVDGVRLTAQPPPVDTVVRYLAKELGIDAHEIVAVFRTRFLFDQDWIQIEADQFIQRVAASSDGLRAALGETQPKGNGAVNINPVLGLQCHFRIDRAWPDTTISVNVRIRNKGNSTISSGMADGVFLSYHWIRTPDGKAEEGLRTPLLVDLRPGAELSLPVFIRTPASLGEHVLKVRAVHETVRWLDEALEFPVEITNDPGPSFEWKPTGQFYPSYAGDHDRAIELLSGWVRDLGRPVTLIELGGNANPMTAGVQAAEKINVDIDPYGMILGSLRRQNIERQVRFVVADGMNLPFRARSVDVIAMFATFHHFPDPTGLLRHLAQFVVDDGLICLMCEPIGHVHRDTQSESFVGELLRGVNEQSFELWEYAQMFSAAGLEIADCRLDVGSLKVALRCRPSTTKLQFAA
jgi:SAM-dependent methyltransferase